MLKIFESFEFLGKCLLIRVRNLRPMFVETFWLYGGLNQVIFRRRFFRFLFSLLLFRSSRNSVISQKPLSARALSYIGLGSPNAVSFILSVQHSTSSFLGHTACFVVLSVNFHISYSPPSQTGAWNTSLFFRFFVFRLP